jgi:IS5 family transposase
MQREITRLKRFLGRVYRNVRRKLANRPDLADGFAQPLALIERLLIQQRADKHKLYALPAPEVECLSKGKIGKRYEFGVKVALATTNREGLVVAMQALPGNPHDGHTLAPTLAQVERLTGVVPTRCFVDRGYRGHGVGDTTTVIMAGQRHGLSASLRRELRQRRQTRPQPPQGRAGRRHPRAAVRRAGHNLRLLLDAPCQASSRPAPAARRARSQVPPLASLSPKLTSSGPIS